MRTRGRPQHPDTEALRAYIDQQFVTTGEVPSLGDLYTWIHMEREAWDAMTSEQKRARLLRPVLFHRKQMARSLVARHLKERREAFLARPALATRLNEATLGWSSLQHWDVPTGALSPAETYIARLDTVCRGVFGRGIPPKAAEWGQVYTTELQQVDWLAALCLLTNFDFAEVATKITWQRLVDVPNSPITQELVDRRFDTDRLHKFIQFAPWLAPEVVDLDALFAAGALRRVELLAFYVKPLAEKRWSQLRWWLTAQLTMPTFSTLEYYPRLDDPEHEVVQLDGTTETWSWARAINEIAKAPRRTYS